MYNLKHILMTMMMLMLYRCTCTLDDLKNINFIPIFSFNIFYQLFRNISGGITHKRLRSYYYYYYCYNKT